MGNIAFVPNPHNDTTCVVDTENQSFQYVSSCFPNIDLGRLLTTRTITRQDTFRTSTIALELTAERAHAHADLLAKDLYGRIFHWLVHKFNSIVGDSMSSRYLAIADMPGFENVAENSFEQLSINYCDERLHNYFCSTILSADMQLYESECLSLSGFEFSSRVECLDLFDGDKGVFHFLEEQSSLKRSNQSGGGDESAALLKAIVTHHARKNPYLVFKKGVTVAAKSTTFTVSHFVSVVEYSATQFHAKNSDQLESDAEVTLRQCSSPLVVALYEQQDVNCVGAGLSGSGHSGGGIGAGAGAGDGTATSTEVQGTPQGSSPKRSILSRAVSRLTAVGGLGGGGGLKKRSIPETVRLKAAMTEFLSLCKYVSCHSVTVR